MINRGKRIPEAFLWQLLRDFAKTAEHMSKVRFPEATDVGNHPYVLHLDLKDENGKKSFIEHQRVPTKIALSLVGKPSGC